MHKKKLILPAIAWFLPVVLAIGFSTVGILKLTDSPGMVEKFNRIDAGQWLRPVIGLAELISAVGIIIPPISRYFLLLLSALMFGAGMTEWFILEETPKVPLFLLCLTLLAGYLRGLERKEPPLFVQRICCFILGAGFSLVGIARFFSFEHSENWSTPEPVHGLLHLVSGLLFLWGAFYKSGIWSLPVNRGLGPVWLGLGIAGNLNFLEGIENLAFNDNSTHLIVGIVTTSVGYASLKWPVKVLK